MELQIPQKGFTKAEREWLKELLEAIKTVQAVAGRNVSIDKRPNQGTVINASDCEPCS